jgi:adenylate cyclase
MSKRQLEFVVPVVVLVVFLLLNIDFDGRLTIAERRARAEEALATGEPISLAENHYSAIHILEDRAYDLLLRIRPAFNRGVVQRDDVLFMDVDDTAIIQVGDWPWPRDHMARGLVTLREFESDFVTFDIEYVEASQLAVDRDYLTRNLPFAIQDEFDYLYQTFEGFIQAILDGQIPLGAAMDVLPDISFIAADGVSALQDDIGRVVQDNDQLLGEGAAFHGQAYFTVNILEPAKIVNPDPETFQSRILEDELRALAIAKAGQPVDRTGRELPRTGLDVLPAIYPVLSGAAGAGFPNVVVDNDGVRRRIDLLAEVDGTYYAQLILAPMLDLMGNPEIEATDDEVVLRGAILPDETEPTDITIPLGADGRMLINWPETSYLDSFRHETFYRLVDTANLEDGIINNMRLMAENGYLDFYESASFGPGANW